MKKIEIIKQQSPNECGLCCCKMVLEYYDCHIEYRHLRTEIGSIRDGVNLFDMKKVFEKNGFTAKIYRNSLNFEKDEWQKLPMPMILFWENNHFVVLEKMTKKNLFSIVDPAAGRLFYSYEELKNKYSGIFLSVFQTEATLRNKKETFKQKWGYFLNCLKDKQFKICFTLLLSTATYAVTLVSASFTKNIVNSITSFSQQGHSEVALKAYFQLFTLLFFTSFFVIFMRELITLSLVMDTEKTIVSKAFKKTLNLPYSFFESRMNGELLNSLGSVSLLKEFLMERLTKMIFNIGLLLLIALYVASISLELFSLVALGIILGRIVLKLLAKSISQLGSEEFTYQSKSNSLQIETLSAIQLTKTLRLEKEVYKKWERNFMDLLKVKKNKLLLNGILVTVNEGLTTFLPIIVLLIGGVFVLNKRASLGEVILIQTYSLTMMSLAAQISGAFQEYIVNSSFIDKVNDLVLQESEQNGENESNEINLIELKNLSFSYTPKTAPILKDISLSIRKGEKIAFVGATGCGKSTLIKVIAGLYRYKELPIYYDGKPLEEYDKYSLSKQIGMVSQDMYFSADTILENIRSYRNEYSEEAIYKAAKSACIHEEIEQFPMKYNTVLTETGSNISGGQRQRISIARALLSEPSLLVFDEGTSFLDNRTEKMIMSKLLEQKSTIIMVAHRLETILQCDKIYFIENGQIVEEGSYQELIEKKGKYYKLHQNENNLNQAERLTS